MTTMLALPTKQTLTELAQSLTNNGQITTEQTTGDVSHFIAEQTTPIDLASN